LARTGGKGHATNDGPGERPVIVVAVEYGRTFNTYGKKNDRPGNIDRKCRGNDGENDFPPGAPPRARRLAIRPTAAIND